jgi:C4-dicarboxylate transporter
MYLFLARSIRELQWHALLLQACGLAVTQAGNTNLNYSPSVYALLVLMTCIGSVAGVLNDHYCKSTKASLNAQNMLLYVVGVVLNFTIFLAKRAQHSDEPGFFEGYGSFGAVALIFLNASIGLIITMVYKCKRASFHTRKPLRLKLDADAIVKGMATSITTAILLVVSALCFNAPLTTTAAAGCVCVFLSSYTFIRAALKPPTPGRQKVKPLYLVGNQSLTPC